MPCRIADHRHGWDGNLGLEFEGIKSRGKGAGGILWSRTSAGASSDPFWGARIVLGVEILLISNNRLIRSHRCSSFRAKSHYLTLPAPNLGTVESPMVSTLWRPIGIRYTEFRAS